MLNNRVMVLHGGLFKEDGVKLDDIRAVDRFREPPDSGIMCDCLWSDPQPENGRAPSKRGCGIQFGAASLAPLLGSRRHMIPLITPRKCHLYVC